MREGIRELKLEAGKTYKLIDKVGYLEEDEDNKEYYIKHFSNDEVTLTGVDSRGEGYVKAYYTTVIGNTELIFFSLVEENKEPHLWDGKETLEVGMRVNTTQALDDCTFEVVLIEGTQIVLMSWCGLLMLEIIGNLRTVILNEKEVFASKMLDKVRSSQLDFAQGTTWNIKDLSGMCWDELMEGKDDKEI